MAAQKCCSIGWRICPITVITPLVTTLQSAVIILSLFIFLVTVTLFITPVITTRPGVPRDKGC